MSAQHQVPCTIQQNSQAARSCRIWSLCHLALWSLWLVAKVWKNCYICWGVIWRPHLPITVIILAGTTLCACMLFACHSSSWLWPALSLYSIPSPPFTLPSSMEWLRASLMISIYAALTTSVSSIENFKISSTYSINRYSQTHTAAVLMKVQNIYFLQRSQILRESHPVPLPAYSMYKVQ